MGQTPFWQAQLIGEGRQRLHEMIGAIEWVRQHEQRYAVFGDLARADRYVQFANSSEGKTTEPAVVTSVALPPVLASVRGGSDVGALAPAWSSIFGDHDPRYWAPYAGEPDHQVLLMEVGSGNWPKASREGLADDESIVASLASYGLVIGGAGHDCRNFCRDRVTEPSDILAAVADEIMVTVLRARPDYRLTVKIGCF
jgi:hypothetical protein